MRGMAGAVFFGVLSFLCAGLAGFALTHDASFAYILSLLLFVSMMAAIFSLISRFSFENMGNREGVSFFNRTHNQEPVEEKKSREVMRLFVFVISVFAPVGMVAFFWQNVLYALICSFFAGIAFTFLSFHVYHEAYREAIRRNILLEYRNIPS